MTTTEALLKKLASRPGHRIDIWRDMRVSALHNEIRDRGGILHVVAVFPDTRIEIWPPDPQAAKLEEPQTSRVEEMEEPKEMEGDPRLGVRPRIVEAEPQSSGSPRAQASGDEPLTVVAPGENKCQTGSPPATAGGVNRSAASSSGQTKEDIMRMWRERGF